MALCSSLHHGFTAIGILECIISKCGFQAGLIPKGQRKEIGEQRARSYARNPCNNGNPARVRALLPRVDSGHAE